MTLFKALRHNRRISILTMKECSFYEVGFMNLQDMIRGNQSIGRLEMKDIIQMGVNTQDPSLALKNFLYVIKALEDNNFITEAVFSIYHNSNSSDPVFLGNELRLGLNELVSNNISLKVLKIEGFRLGGAEICTICESLQNNNSLETLVLTGNLVE